VIVPYQLFDTADLPLCLAPGNDRLWARCAQVLGHPEWGADPRFAKTAQRVKHKDTLLPMIANVMRTRPRAEWLAALDRAGVPCSPVNDIAELAATDQLAAVDLVRRLPARSGEPNGPEIVGLPICFDRQRPHSPRSAPKLGEHTKEVLG
jgi:crotonobetainyl-CoA:carnitine CoA-transferase CaiB-like acyl-CoA transferase